MEATLDDPTHHETSLWESWNPDCLSVTSHSACVAWQVVGIFGMNRILSAQQIHIVQVLIGDPY